jgi:hypothetical protein
MVAKKLLFVRRCSAWNGLRAFSKFLVRYTLLVTNTDERRRQIVVCPPVDAAGLAIFLCGAGLSSSRIPCGRHPQEQNSTVRRGYISSSDRYLPISWISGRYKTTNVIEQMTKPRQAYVRHKLNAIYLM